MNMGSLWRLWIVSPSEGGGLGVDWTHGIVFAVIFCALVDFVKLLIELLGREDERTFRTDAAELSVVIPCRNGAKELATTLQELLEFLPPERILVVDDASTDDSSAVAKRAGVRLFRFEKPKGKAAAINFAVHRVETPLTLLLDDDTRLGGARIPTSLISSDGFDAVAFHVLPDRRNRDGARGNNFLGHLQRYEYGKSMEIGKRFHDVTYSVSCISGAAGLFRTADLHELHHEHSGVFQAEDLQRSIIHLLNRRRIVFANEPVWTVAPWTLSQWFRQRMWGWYPGMYHQLANFLRLFVRRGVSWRLRYEMAYNLYTVLTDPFKTLSIVLIVALPALRPWGLVLYLIYLAFEIYPWWSIRVPGSRRRAPLGVLLFYPVYGAINTLLRTVAVLWWFWFRFVSGSMRPRRGPEDRIE
jgi:cellulose synthase/poly-beta-1,6-N-acetylglucosamine synthase-like glycosyltransferase